MLFSSSCYFLGNNTNPIGIVWSVPMFCVIKGLMIRFTTCMGINLAEQFIWIALAR